jgi:hypothetical protein
MARGSEVLARARLKGTATRPSPALEATVPAIVLGRHSVSTGAEQIAESGADAVGVLMELDAPQRAPPGEGAP